MYLRCGDMRQHEAMHGYLFVRRDVSPHLSTCRTRTVGYVRHGFKCMYISPCRQIGQMATIVGSLQHFIIAGQSEGKRKKKRNRNHDDYRKEDVSGFTRTRWRNCDKIHAVQNFAEFVYLVVMRFKVGRALSRMLRAKSKPG
ncbi:hypothetical protein GGX14DRAFT_390433 [Mycena pura]|uniref:Uncharacterized protein n=1 Tax=Mycena pura TaxID=153505 RepID=A0AAD6VP26_9AGAR|nr:hypothetical protein GGX14DRAFT_390433 [Mycena pura]